MVRWHFVVGALSGFSLKVNVHNFSYCLSRMSSPFTAYSFSIFFIDSPSYSPNIGVSQLGSWV